MYAFMDWAKLHWKDKMCLHTEYKLWNAMDWSNFTSLMDDEFEDYLKNRQEDEEMDKDTFVRLVVIDFMD